MGLFGEDFDAFRDADFDAYLGAKRSSRRFNLERGRVRARLVALLEAAIAGGDWAGVEVWSSQDHPSVWNGHEVAAQTVALCRDADARGALARADAALDADRVDDSHIHLGIRVDDTGVTRLLALPARAHFDRSSAATALEALAALPPALGVWQDGDGAAIGLDAGVLGRGGPALRFVQRVERAEAIAAGSDAVAALRAWLEAVRAAFFAASWAPERDPEGLAAAVAAAAAPAAPDKPVEVVVEVAKPRPQIAAPGTATPEPEPPPPLRPPPRPVQRPAQGAAPARPQSSRLAPPQSTSRSPQRPASPSDGPARTGRDDRAGGRPPGRRDDAHGDRRGGRSDDRRDERRDARPAGPRGPYQIRPEREPTAALAAGSEVVIRSGLLAGREAVVLAVKGASARVSASGLEVTLPLSELAPR